MFSHCYSYGFSTTMMLNLQPLESLEYLEVTKISSNVEEPRRSSIWMRSYKVYLFCNPYVLIVLSLKLTKGKIVRALLGRTHKCCYLKLVVKFSCQNYILISSLHLVRSRIRIKVCSWVPDITAFYRLKAKINRSFWRTSSTKGKWRLNHLFLKLYSLFYYLRRCRITN